MTVKWKKIILGSDMPWAVKLWTDPGVTFNIDLVAWNEKNRPCYTQLFSLVTLYSLPCLI